MSQFALEVIKAVDEGFDIKVRKGFFKHSIVLQIIDYGTGANISKDIEASTADDAILAGNLRHLKIQLLRKGLGRGK